MHVEARIHAQRPGDRGASHPCQQRPNEPDGPGQRRHGISRKTNEDGVSQSTCCQRLAWLHRYLQDRKVAAKCLQSVADMVLIADRDACRGQHEVGVLRRVPKCGLHRRGSVLDERDRPDLGTPARQQGRKHGRIGIVDLAWCKAFTETTQFAATR